MAALAQQQTEGNRARWSGTASAALPTVSAGRAWALLSDFYAIHRWLPGVESCERAAGRGDVRRVADAAGERWALEELLAADAAGRRMQYAVVDSNMGLRGYAATLKVVPEEAAGEEEEEAGGGGCRIEWSFECDPAEGLSRDWLVAYLDAGAKGMAERVEAAVRAEDAAAEEAPVENP